MPARATEFWLGANGPFQPYSPRDYLDLFAPGAPWKRSASRLSAFKVTAGTLLHGSDAMVRSIFDSMHQRRVAVALEIGAVLQQPGEGCGGGEGYSPPNVLSRIGARLRALGLTLDMLAMDSPVWIGHERSWGRNEGRPDCQYALAEVARRSAQAVLILRQSFPALLAGEIEAVNGRIDPRIVLGDYARFAQMMRQLTGQPLVFFHCDTAWQSPGWPRIIAALRQQTHAAGMRFGIIIGGSSPQDQTDTQWVTDGLQRLSMLSSPATRPDDVIVQSWQPLPTRMLPETMPGTSTYMLAEAERLLP